MSRIARNYRNSRAVMAIVFLVVALLFAWWLSTGEPVSTRLVQGQVLPVTGTESGGLSVVPVMLDNGERVMLYSGGRRYLEEERITLIETQFSDGEKRYRIKPPGWQNQHIAE